MKRLFYLILCIALLTGCAPLEGGQTTPQYHPDNVEDPMEVETMTATIEMKDGGVIVAELYPKAAPQSVCNFVYLAREGFYDGLIFHRVVEGFMIQGGDINGTGSGSPGYCIKGEFSVNGFENSISHTRGTLSFARRGDPLYDSAGSQFFIMHKDNKGLDGLYAAFGRVIQGMDVVDRIAAVKTERERPLEDVVIKKVTIDGPALPEPEKLPVP